SHELATRHRVFARRADREVFAPHRLVGHRASPLPSISSSPNGSACHGRVATGPVTSIGPGPSATAYTLVVTCWLPNSQSFTSVPRRVVANSSGVPNQSA